MGLSHSSTPLSGEGKLCAASGGVAETAAHDSALKDARTAKSAPSWLLLAAIRFYQAAFAALMPSGCKFYPSCSRYASEAIGRYGALKGSQLAAARLLRCRPFTQGGYDPVPEFEARTVRNSDDNVEDAEKKHSADEVAS